MLKTFKTYSFQNVDILCFSIYNNIIIENVIYFFTDQRHVVVSMELKGPDNSLRVRQIRMLGEIEGGSLKVGKQLSAQTIQQRNCEAETLKVFRLITSQVNKYDFS